MSKLRLRLAQENGHIHNGKQNYRCLDCGRQFVADYVFQDGQEETRELIKKACWSAFIAWNLPYFRCQPDVVVGICRELYAVLPADLGIDLQSAGGSDAVSLFTLAVEADEMWSFVAMKSNKQ